MNKTKVLYFSPVGFFKGGAERSLFDLLANPHITPVLVVPEEGPIAQKARESGITCYILPFGSIADIRRPFSFLKSVYALRDLWQTAQQLKRISLTEHASFVHSNGLKAHMINCISRRIGGAKAVLHIRDIPYTRSEILVWRLLYTLSDALVLVSRACWPLEALPAKAFVIHNGTNLIPETKKVQHADNSPLMLGFVGRIHPAKGLHLLLEWMSAAHKEGLTLQLSIRGSFSEDAPHYEKEIHAQIKRLGLQDVASFTGFLNDSNQVYDGLDIVVVPSETPDPLPRSVMESMARGIPVLGYPAGGISDMVIDGETGFLVKDETTFMRAIKIITQDAASLEVLTKRAREKIAEDFTITSLHRLLCELYKHLQTK